MYALHRCGWTDQLVAPKATWVTSLISLPFELTSQGENPTPRINPLRWQNPQRKREQLGSDLETPLGYTLVGVVLNTSPRLQLPTYSLWGAASDNGFGHTLESPFPLS